MISVRVLVLYNHGIGSVYEWRKRRGIKDSTYRKTLEAVKDSLVDNTCPR